MRQVYRSVSDVLNSPGPNGIPPSPLVVGSDMTDFQTRNAGNGIVDSLNIPKNLRKEEIVLSNDISSCTICENGECSSQASGLVCRIGHGRNMRTFCRSYSWA